MQDSGFRTDEELRQLKVNLHTPAFLVSRSQLTKAEVKESQTTASVRIHVEQAFRTFRKIQNYLK